MKRALPVILIIAIALIIWCIFYPAFMNGDSLVQYGEALAGNYDDWHPPVMAIVLHYILRLGGNIGSITLIQTLSGCAGIYLLSKEILRIMKVSEKEYTYFPLTLLVFLLMPFSPLPFHLMAFIKDTWVEIGFLWIAYLSLRIMQNRLMQHKKNKSLLFLLFTIMLLVLLARHNSIVLLPVFILIFYFISGNYISTKKFRIQGIENGIYLAVLFALVSHEINTVFRVKKTHPENQVIATECLGVLVNNIDTKKYLPYMFRHLTKIYVKAYIPGNVAPVMWWGPVKAVDNSFDMDSAQLSVQYYDLLLHAPFSVLKVKWDGFSLMLIPCIKGHWFHPQLDDNNYGLIQNERFKKTRLEWIKISTVLLGIKYISFWLGSHLAWMIINLLFLIFLLLKRRSNNALFIILLLMPFVYYSSFLLASTDPDFRFMYPSTLFAEVVVFSMGFVFIRKNLLKLIVK